MICVVSKEHSIFTRLGMLSKGSWALAFKKICHNRCEFNYHRFCPMIIHISFFSFPQYSNLETTTLFVYSNGVSICLRFYPKSFFIYLKIVNLAEFQFICFLSFLSSLAESIASATSSPPNKLKFLFYKQTNAAYIKSYPQADYGSQTVFVFLPVLDRWWLETNNETQYRKSDRLANKYTKSWTTAK